MFWVFFILNQIPRCPALLRHVLTKRFAKSKAFGLNQIQFSPLNTTISQNSKQRQRRDFQTLLYVLNLLPGPLVNRLIQFDKLFSFCEDAHIHVVNNQDIRLTNEETAHFQMFNLLLVGYVNKLKYSTLFRLSVHFKSVRRLQHLLLVSMQSFSCPRSR